MNLKNLRRPSNVRVWESLKCRVPTIGMRLLQIVFSDIIWGRDPRNQSTDSDVRQVAAKVDMICRNEEILCSCVRWKWSKEVSAARGIEIGVSYTPSGKRLARLERARLACRRYSSSDMGLRLKDSRDRTRERISEKDIRFLSIDWIFGRWRISAFAHCRRAEKSSLRESMLGFDRRELTLPTEIKNSLVSERMALQSLSS